MTSDGGRTWTLPNGKPPAGYRSAVAYVPGASQPTVVAVGPTGSDLSTDGGESWSPLGTMGFHAVGCSGPTDARLGSRRRRIDCAVSRFVRRETLAPSKRDRPDPRRDGTEATECKIMATKPTRLQQQACDHLAETLFLITEACRLDGKGKLDPSEFDSLATMIAQVSSAFSLDEIVVKASRGEQKAWLDVECRRLDHVDGGEFETVADSAPSGSRIRGTCSKAGRRVVEICESQHL